MRLLRITVVGLLLGVGAAAAAKELLPPREPDVPVYFALEVRQAGRVVARPQLVGVSGHGLRALLRRRDGVPRLELQMSPTVRGNRVGVDLQLDLPDERGLGKSISLHHGEESQVRLSPDVEVKILAMRVQSPEFEAYIANAPEPDDDGSAADP